MAKYMRDSDSEIFDENKVYDAVEEEIDDEDMEEAMSHFAFRTIFKHLDEEMQNMIWDEARTTVLEERFTIIEDEEDEE